MATRRTPRKAAATMILLLTVVAASPSAWAATTGPEGDREADHGNPWDHVMITWADGGDDPWKPECLEDIGGCMPMLRDMGEPCQGGDCIPDPTPACRDGVDNDGDGFRDYPRDPECLDRNDPSESRPGCTDVDDCLPDSTLSVEVIILENSFLDGIGAASGSCFARGTYSPSTIDGVDAAYDWCLEVSGTCTLAIHEESSAEATWWALLFIGGIKLDTSVEVYTELNCEGEYAMTFEHYDGLGLRNVVVTEETSGNSETNENGVSKGSCEYIAAGPAGLDRCTTPFGGEWDAHVTRKGEIESWCVGKTWSVQNDPAVSLGGFLELDGQESKCWNALDFVEERIPLL